MIIHKNFKFSCFFKIGWDYTKAMLEDIKQSKNLDIMIIGGGRT